MDFLESYRKTLLGGGEVIEIDECINRIRQIYLNATQKSLKPLVNATGIVCIQILEEVCFLRQVGGN